MTPRVLVLDHFDSFTYILVELLLILGAEVLVVRTNRTLDDVLEELRQQKFVPTHIVLSPGPGHPKDVPLFLAALRRYAGVVPILGVCLGHQAIGLFAGGRVERSRILMHGKTSRIYHNTRGIFAGLPDPFVAMRFHSLIVEWPALPPYMGRRERFDVTAWSGDEEVMAIELHDYPHVYGVQFHPESFKTEGGKKIIANFLAMRRVRTKL